MIKKLLLIIFIAGLMVWLRQEYAEYLTFESLQANKEVLSTYVADNYILSVLIYVITYILVTGLNIPGAVVLSLSGGFIFGAFAGTVMAVASATTGASIAFIISRYLLGTSLNNKYQSQLKKLNGELNKNGHMYMLTLRLIPIFPFFIINILAGLTNMRLLTFIWTSFIGMIPGGFVFVYAGSRLNEVSSVKDIFSGQMLSAFVLLGLLMLIPVAYNKIKGRA